MISVSCFPTYGLHKAKVLLCSGNLPGRRPTLIRSCSRWTADSWIHPQNESCSCWLMRNQKVPTASCLRHCRIILFHFWSQQDFSARLLWPEASDLWPRFLSEEQLSPAEIPASLGGAPSGDGRLAQKPHLMIMFSLLLLNMSQGSFNFLHQNHLSLNGNNYT